VVAPLAAHPSRAGEIIVYDLTADPSDLLALDDGDIADRVFTSRADLPEGVERIALRTIRANHAPALAPLSVLKGADHARLGLDMDAVERHLGALRHASGLAEKLRRVYAHAAALPPAEDPELALYGGFLPDADRRLLAEVRATPPEQLGTHRFNFRDPRYPELLFRYRARNWPETLTLEEHERWEAFRADRLTRHGPLTTLTLDDYDAELATLRALPGAPLALLDELEAWGQELR
jgi:exodeoxyribonuclease-1